MLLIATALMLAAGPLLYGLLGLLRTRRAPPNAGIARGPWPWRRTVVSALLYVFAFNLVFFIQELFLVLPKALTPGLRPTLFHNNHAWDGEHPLASLFQGTGALATLVIGFGCGLVLRRGGGSPAQRMLLFWMAFGGIFMALPQVVIGAFSPQSDLGMAMDYLRLGSMAKTAAALAALVAIPLAALWLLRPLLGLADNPARIGDAGARSVFVLLMATLPALVAIVPIVLFRVPREWIEVVMLPVIVTVAGLVWMQAGAWRIADAKAAGGQGDWPIAWPLAAVLMLLLVFQLVLRPGISFY